MANMATKSGTIDVFYSVLEERKPLLTEVSDDFYH